MAGPDRLLRVKAELVSDLERLDLLEVKNRRAAERIAGGARDELDYAALGYTIHNIYSLIESYAHRIAKTFENEIDPLHWHRDLIERMTLNIETVRPALWDRKTAAGVDELRRFRHVFRNLYQSELDPERLALIQNRLPALLGRFRGAHAAFIENIDRLLQTTRRLDL